MLDGDKATPVIGPLSADEAFDLLQPLVEASGVVLAVSGGPDSIALMHLAAAATRHAAQRGIGLPRFMVGTVDHRLRPQAREDVEIVIGQARALGLPAHRLAWEDPKPERGVQEAARAARYALLTDLARREGASHLVTAHTLDDQAETVLFRLSRGSGPAGLAGMRPRVARGGLVHVRPFLGVAKARLVAACRAGGWAFVEDPSNHDPRFARSRWRALMPALAAEGLDADRIATLARRMQRLDEALFAKGEAARVAACRLWQSDLRIFSLRNLLDEPDAVLIRVIEQSLTDFAAPGPPRLKRLEALIAALRQGGQGKGPWRRSLHHALVSVPQDGTLTLTHAPPRRGR